MKQKHVVIPFHVQLVLDDLTKRTPLTESEIIRQAILTFEQAINQEDDSYHYVRAFIEMESQRGLR